MLISTELELIMAILSTRHIDIRLILTILITHCKRVKKSDRINTCKTTEPEENIQQVLLHTIATDTVHFF
jgi:hypothetical protein